MIVDLARFLKNERPFWDELGEYLDQLEHTPGWVMSMEEVQRFHWLYERAAADLGRITTFSAEPETRRFLETLVARAYGEIHETRRGGRQLRPLEWVFKTLPGTFRTHVAEFRMALVITLVGVVFGAGALAFDPGAKQVIMPFSHLLGDPSDRVAEEEQAVVDRMAGAKSTFSATLVTHNTRVSILALALGISWGVGSIVLLFYNGVILGAVVFDYMRAGEASFLFGWLLPHGAIEIPAILIAGQAGLVLAKAMIGSRQSVPIGMRLRKVGGDLVTLIFGVALLLVWAGFVESFLSQYHEPVIPYAAKTAFGCVELVLLYLFLTRSGKEERKPADEAGA